MDAADDDRDIVLQRASADLLADLESSLVPFLWKTTSSGKSKVRRRVRVSETDRLVNLLEPFQELPQLLDPHLDKFVPVLANAFLSSLQLPPPKSQHATDTKLLVPLTHAICRLLYTFCKIRGEKVIVRFLSTETRHLELLLSAIETGEEGTGRPDAWSWEERYITLLWLSQLLLAPFDLATISSTGSGTATPSTIPNLEWPPSVPTVAQRLVPLTIRYLSSSGKERDAARILLVRIVMRRDMQELGVLRALFAWTFIELRPMGDVRPVYHYIGILSFIAGVLGSSIGTRDADTFLPHVFRIVSEIAAKENAVSKAISNSAVARKTIIKVLRSIAVHDLSIESAEGSERVESTIGTLLEYLSDPTTPVRLAASKALSVITLKLESEMAGQVVEAVIDSLEVGVKWLDPPINGIGFQLTNANPLEWHGLILTLSHLLYRRSLPSSSLSHILPYLVIGLSFEQRATSGASIGTNVRDASCFGIWALSRRYRTAEIDSVVIKVGSLSSAVPAQPNVSALQRLATELVVSGCLDPAGNIRRGASAALQELIGRHPDIIEEGIQVVQVVDYHAVALRSRSMQETAVQAAQLSNYYYEGLKQGLLGWRGVQDTDAAVRRVVASGFAKMVEAKQVSAVSFEVFGPIIDDLFARLRSAPKREVGHYHGLLLCLASVMDHLGSILTPSRITSALEQQNPASGLQGLIRSLRLRCKSEMNVLLLSLNTEAQRHKSPELLAEAASRFMLATYPILRADVAFNRSSLRQKRQALSISDTAESPDKAVEAFLNGPQDNNSVDGYLKALETLYKMDEENGVAADGLSAEIRYCRPDVELCETMSQVLAKLLALDEDDCVNGVSEAASDHLFLVDAKTRSTIIENWVQQIKNCHLHGQGRTFIRALFNSFIIADATQKMQILDVIQKRWSSSQERHDMVICSTILSSMPSSSMLKMEPEYCIALIKNGLDDYTTNARGDIGSLLRIEAAKAAAVMWKLKPFGVESYSLFGKILRVAVEKLDKVRIEGQKAVASALGFELPQNLKSYFQYFLEMEQLYESWVVDMFEGYVVTADAGSEDIVRASRAALVEFSEATPANADLVCQTVYVVMNRNLTNDRVLVSALEVMAFMFDTGIAQKSSIDCKSLFMFVQKAHYQTKNVRKLEAATKLYGGMAEVYPPALGKLCTMLLHPYPTIRNLVIEEIFVAKGIGKGIDWGKAKKPDVERIRKELSIG